MRALAHGFFLLFSIITTTAADAAEPATGATAQLEDRYPERRTAFPHGITGLADVTYSAPTGFRPLTLDLYLPRPRTAARPLLIYIHGGGWMSGHARHCGAFENWPRVLADLAARGYVVASVNYRLSGEAASPAAAHDIANAVRWLRARAASYSIDKQRVGVWGASAGGQLAAIAGTACEAGGEESACVQAVAAWYGIFDFAPLVANGDATSPAMRYLGCESGVCANEKVLGASAIRHVDASDPPFLLIHGSRDRTVAPAQSTAFYDVLQAQHVKSQLIMIEGVDHSFIGNTPEATRAASLRALHATIDFFDQTLSTSTAP